MITVLIFVISVNTALADKMANSDSSQTSTAPSPYFPPANQAQPPSALVKCLRMIEVEYFDEMNKLQTGRLVVNKDLAEDVQKVFKVIKESHFPIKLVALASDPKFNWSDDALMNADATSAYNYRLKVGGSSLSAHGLGRALDINTKCNPYIKYDDRGQPKRVEPKNAFYDPKARCAISRETEAGRRIINEFQKLGWKWGGDWKNPKDYQHFEKMSDSGSAAPYCN